jgi:hypothetical protein
VQSIQSCGQVQSISTKCHPFDMLLVLAEKVKIVNTSTHDELEDIIPRTVMKKQLLGLDLR